jgi:hypothetical protein
MDDHILHANQFLLAGIHPSLNVISGCVNHQSSTSLDGATEQNLGTLSTWLRYYPLGETMVHSIYVHECSNLWCRVIWKYSSVERAESSKGLTLYKDSVGIYIQGQLLKIMVGHKDLLFNDSRTQKN